MSERDPRLDPRPGDIVDRQGRRRIVSRVATIKTDTGITRLVLTESDRGMDWRYSIQAWRGWAKTANIIKYGAHE